MLDLYYTLAKLTTRMFSRVPGKFRYHDIVTVCQANNNVPDHVLHAMCQYFVHHVSKPGELYVEDPAVVATLLNLDTLEPRHSGIAALKKRLDSEQIPRWSDRLKSGATVAVPVNYPVNEHWLLVVLWISKKKKQPKVLVWDPLTKNYKAAHSRLARGVHAICYQLGGMEGTKMMCTTAVSVFITALVLHLC